ncbi:hypothetical protein HKBW3S47_00243 [Candidatus Hakubella thermalkaliphila]|uniref:Uncharacterized protein n=1 Tax=Candidatus Hakubella thermalkaliphila TaxID=2754717 RepID=A0A6V8Q199_9ACTN|nr:hypothetical protein [Candidatus Hakubella thermalkaliphila]GFP38542.1 hypothetical protein HKBW3S47_00243 [Candidatus Hakubella thermalkaliphila]
MEEVQSWGRIERLGLFKKNVADFFGRIYVKKKFNITKGTKGKSLVDNVGLVFYNIKFLKISRPK